MIVLSVVIPAYNEENGIAEIASRVLSVGPALKKVGVDQLELLVVDDGSRDRTAEVARNIPGVTLIRHPKIEDMARRSRLASPKRAEN